MQIIALGADIVRRKYLCSTLAFFGCILVSTNGFGAGRIVIQPKIEMMYQYDSNYWKANAEEVSVNTYSVKPGFVIGFETPKTTMALDATVDAYWYDDQDTPPLGIAKASEDDYVGFTGDFNVDHQLTDRLNIGLADQLYVTRDPARADANNNSINRDQYTINYFEPKVYYEFADKFGFLSMYRSTITDYEKDLEDSNENRGIFDLYYNLNRSSAVYLDYQLWHREYDQDSSDYTSNFLSLNYKREFNYFTINGGAGYHNRSFDDATIDDFDLFSWKIQLRGQDADSTLKTTRSWLQLDIGQEPNDDGTGDEYFTATYVDFGSGYRFLKSLEASGKVKFQNSNYETDERDEDTYLVSGRLAYQASDYLTIGVEGGYETRNSNVDGNDYDNTFVLFTLDFSYDLGSR